MPPLTFLCPIMSICQQGVSVQTLPFFQMNSVFAESEKPGETKEFFRKSARLKKKSESFFNFPESSTIVSAAWFFIQFK